MLSPSSSSCSLLVRIQNQIAMDKYLTETLKLCPEYTQHPRTGYKHNPPTWQRLHLQLQKHILRVYLTKKISFSIVHLAWFNLENNYTFSSKLQCKFPGKLCSLKSQPWTGCLLNSAQNIVGLLAWVRNNIYILCLSSSGISITPIIHRNQLASDQPG